MWKKFLAFFVINTSHLAWITTAFLEFAPTSAGARFIPTDLSHSQFVALREAPLYLSVNSTTPHRRQKISFALGLASRGVEFRSHAVSNGCFVKQFIGGSILDDPISMGPPLSLAWGLRGALEPLHRAGGGAPGVRASGHSAKSSPPNSRATAQQFLARPSRHAQCPRARVGRPALGGQSPSSSRWITPLRKDDLLVHAVSRERRRVIACVGTPTASETPLPTARGGPPWRHFLPAHTRLSTGRKPRPSPQGPSRR